MKKYLSIIANSILFFGSLSLLIDVAPSDFSPSFVEQKQAINLFKEYRIVMQPVVNVNFNFEGGQGLIDYDKFIVLKKFIQNYSPHSDYIDWDEIIGIGYSKISLSTYGYEYDAVRPLYIAKAPIEKDKLRITAIGELSDLNEWLKLRHQKSLINTAVIFLVAGFFIQFVSSILSPKYDTKIVSTEKGKSPNKNIDLNPNTALNISTEQETIKDQNNIQ